MTELINNKAIILISLFAALTAVAAFIKIPLPYIPLTLQTLVVFLAADLLGPFYATMSQVIYLTIGLMGLPLFANGGGLGYIFQPTFGYLVGFPVCTATSAFLLARFLPSMDRPEISRSRNFFILILANLLGLLLIYGIGFWYFYLNLKYSLYMNLENASSFAGMKITDLVKIGIVSPLPGDLIKIILASYLALKLRPILNFRLR